VEKDPEIKEQQMSGPLQGIRIIELAGIGPAPFCGMLLADHGAEVIRVARPGRATDAGDVLQRSRKCVTLDLKTADGVGALKELVGTADALIEGFRPGTLERLGIGPDILMAENPALVIGRMTGWGQTGPYASNAGHDINYIALSGALHAVGPADHPALSLGLAGDFGGGGMLLAFALTAALLRVRSSGEGQVIDCAMTEGSAMLMGLVYGMYATGQWRDEREVNMLDGGAHFYGVYGTADGKLISIGAIEPEFYALLLDRLGLSEDEEFRDQMDQQRWPGLRQRLKAIFRTRSRDEWCALMDRSDICFAPVLGMAEAPYHEHMAARGAFVEVDGIVQPAPAPRYSRTPLAAPRAPEPISLDRLRVR
jgi:alpha-methylacyl-CoA racemase